MAAHTFYFDIGTEVCSQQHRELGRQPRMAVSFSIGSRLWVRSVVACGQMIALTNALAHSTVGLQAKNASAISLFLSLFLCKVNRELRERAEDC